MHLRHLSSRSLTQALDGKVIEFSISCIGLYYIITFNCEKIFDIKEGYGAVHIQAKNAFILLLRICEADTNNLLEV